MIADDDPTVRVIVAERLKPERLNVLANDPDLRVRFTVAERCPLDEVHRFLGDAEDVVREIARARLGG